MVLEIDMVGVELNGGGGVSFGNEGMITGMVE